MSLPRDIEGEYPEICEHATGREVETVAVVVGSAPCRDEDLAALEAMLPGDVDVIAVNWSGADLPHVDYMISIHGDRLGEILDEREGRRLPSPAVAVGTFHGGGQDPRVIRWRVHPYPGESGSSTLLAVRWALFWGYRRIVLCGVPLDGDQTRRPSGECVYGGSSPNGYARYRDGWTQHLETLPLRDCVRSMSGWTRELLGSPDERFLRG